jgi:hypothetical protein
VKHAEPRVAVVTGANQGLGFALGRLRYLPEPLRARFDQASSLRAIDEVMLAYVAWLAPAPRAEVPYGELVQHRKVLAWDE